jgi:hypothetical protein
VNPVVGVSGETEVFSGAGRTNLGFVEQIAPRVVGVGFAPELFVTAQNGDAAVVPAFRAEIRRFSAS